MQPHDHYNRRVKTRGQGSFARATLIVGLLLVGIVTARALTGHALSAGGIIKSGVTGSCLDVYHDSNVAQAVVDNWGCNDSAAQQWTTSFESIKHDGSCLAVQHNATAVGSEIALDSCSGATGQVWLRDKSGYENPGSGLCLAAAGNTVGQQLTLASCSQLTQPDETWTPDSASAAPSCNNGSEGQRVACNAAKEWTAWQSGSPSHEVLLTSYTDGAPYEEWCADFISYVYKEAGYPFTGGETNGWDQNIAGDVQYMGFTKHTAGSYTPQAGDVAYFNYPGGHVEIVASGGPHPTFIYGDSATIDPATGNGDMEANTITSKAGEGQVVYYLSPVKG